MPFELGRQYAHIQEVEEPKELNLLVMVEAIHLEQLSVVNDHSHCKVGNQKCRAIQFDKSHILSTHAVAYSHRENHWHIMSEKKQDNLLPVFVIKNLIWTVRLRLSFIISSLRLFKEDKADHDEKTEEIGDEQHILHPGVHLNALILAELTSHFLVHNLECPRGKWRLLRLIELLCGGFRLLHVIRDLKSDALYAFLWATWRCLTFTITG